MNITVTKKCPSCGALTEVLISNNPVCSGICLKCLNHCLKWDSLKDADFFCRTYNMPFFPDRWMQMAEAFKDHVWFDYAKIICEEYKNKLYYMGNAADQDLWTAVNKQWKRNLSFLEILNNFATIKEGWLKIMQAKWGPNYEVQQYLRLEELTNNTIRATGTSNVLTIDNIRKIATVSVRMDEALENGDIEAASNFSKMHQTLIKSAGLDDMMDVASEDGTILTIADLCSYLEDKGFKFKFYDGVSRDIVDKTIKDQQEWTRTFVLNATGIQQTYEVIENAYRSKLEDNKTAQALNDTPLDALIDANKMKDNVTFDKQLEDEAFDFGDDDDK